MPGGRRGRKSDYRRGLGAEEVMVLQGMRMGRTYREVGREIGLTENQVKVLAGKIFNKLGADNRVQAVLFAMDMNLLGEMEFYGS